MPDGRWLSAESAGPEGGGLVVFHAGTPGSSYLYEGMARKCAERGLRIACASRPGYDGSPRLRGRSYRDNPVDTVALLQFLGVENAYIVGHSGGGGPALADAALLPEKVRAAAAISTLAPREAMGADWRVGLRANERELNALERGEDSLRRELMNFQREMAEAENTPDLVASEGFSEYFSPADQACFGGEFLDFSLECRRRIQSGLDGWVDDDFAFFGDWNFDLGSIRVPVSIWQGGQDKIVPSAHTEWLAADISGARYHLLPCEGHISLIDHHFGDILDELVAAA